MHRDAVDDEHHIRAVALGACRRLDLPLPGDLQRVMVREVVVDDLHRALSLLVLVVPLSLSAQPSQHLAVALDRRRERLDTLDDARA
jgi:hypothetical protein